MTRRTTRGSPSPRWSRPRAGRWSRTTSRGSPTTCSSSGATTIAPGRFNPWGTVVAVYFLSTGIDGLAELGVSSFVQQLFYGGALVIAVLLSSLAGRAALRRIRRPAPAAAPVTDQPQPATT